MTRLRDRIGAWLFGVNTVDSWEANPWRPELGEDTGHEEPAPAESGVRCLDDGETEEDERAIA